MSADFAEGRPFLSRSTVPNGGAIPERDTPDAIIHLVRLARSNSALHGDQLRDRLLWLAAALNARLPAQLRIAPTDPRLRDPLDGEGSALAESAIATIGKYVLNPAIQPELKARQKRFIVLSRYFVWCRGLWNAVEASRSAVEAFEFDYEVMCPNDDIGEQALGAILHWLASLCVVIEGWEELKLFDAAIDAHLESGGNVKTEGSLRHRLQRLRNGVFHFQVRGTEDARFTEFWSTRVVQWAIPLERLFERFFRQTWELQQTNLEPWLFRGLEPRYDPDLTSSVPEP